MHSNDGSDLQVKNDSINHRNTSLRAFLVVDAQKKIWDTLQLLPNMSVSNIYQVIRIVGKLEQGTLLSSLNKLEER